MTVLGHGGGFDIVPIWTTPGQFFVPDHFRQTTVLLTFHYLCLAKGCVDRFLFHCLSADSRLAWPLLALRCHIFHFLDLLAFLFQTVFDPPVL